MIHFSTELRHFDTKIACKELVNGIPKETTYNVLAEKIDSIAIHMYKTHGTRQHIALLGENNSTWIAHCLGIYSSYNIAVSLDPSKDTQDAIDLMNFTEVSNLYISQKQFDERKVQLSSLSHIRIHIMEETPTYMESDVLAAKIEELHKSIRFNENELAHITFTSGTTSTPKGVMHSYASLTSTFRKRNPELNTKEKVMMSISPFHHIYGLVSNILGALYDGKVLCLAGKAEDFIPSISLFEPDYLTIVPSILNKFALIIRKQGVEKFRKIIGKNLTTIGVGGASSAINDLKTILDAGITIYTAYGSTETASSIIRGILRPGDKNIDEIIGSLGNKIHSIGTEVRINEKGECLIKGPSVMLGYYKNEEDTRNFLVDGWFNTQDIVSKEENGYYRCIGRSKNLIILANAENVSPEEIEQKLHAKNPLIDQVLIYEHNKMICSAFYAPELSLEDLETIVEEYNKNIPGYARIAEISQRPKKMPTTAKGTIRKEEVITMILSENKNLSDKHFSADEEAVYRIISSHVELEGVKPDTNIFNYGIDSLTALEIANDLKINIETLYRLPTIQKLAKINDLTAPESSYNHELYYNELNKQKPTTRRRTILITGTTGFLGSYILRELSAEVSLRIVCLVRSEEKQKNVYNRYFGVDIPKNVRIITGDITDKFLGLGFGEYSSLISEIDEVIHAAADVHHAGNFEKSYKTNVVGTQNIVELCKSAKAILHHISTYSISGIGVTKIEPIKTEFEETDFWIGQHYKDNVYVHTKYEAEKAVLQMRADGFQSNIYRVGSIAWDKDGRFQINSEENGLLGRLKGFFECKTYAGETKESYFDITPVDDTAKAICTLFFSKNVNMTYHIFNPNFVTYQKIADLMNIDVKKTTIGEFNKIEDKSKNIRTLKFYTNLSVESASVKLSAEKTSKTLEKYGFKWNDITADYISKHIAV